MNTSLLLLVTVLAVASAGSPGGDDPRNEVVDILTDHVLIYRGELWYRDKPLDGAVDLEFRAFAGASDVVPIAPVIAAEDWPVIDGRFLVELNFGDPSLFANGGWLEVTVDGTILSPRQFIAPSGFALLASDVTSKRIDPARSAEESLLDMTDEALGHRESEQSDAASKANDASSSSPLGSGQVSQGDSPGRGEDSSLSRDKSATTARPTNPDGRPTDPTMPNPPDDDAEEINLASGEWRVTGNEIWYTKGPVGIGTSNPRNGARLHIRNTNGAFNIAALIDQVVAGKWAVYAPRGVNYFGGPVGMGTRNVTEQLTVDGNVAADEFIGLLDWENLTNVPPGFADGIDNTGPSYTARGPELELVGTQFGMARQGASNGQVLKWIDDRWVPRNDDKDGFWRQNGGNIYWLGEGGYGVGIGTDDPLAKLHVAGGGQFEGVVELRNRLEVVGNIETEGSVHAVEELFTDGNVTANGSGFFGDELTCNSGRFFVRDNAGIGWADDDLFQFITMLVDDNGRDWAAWFRGDVRVEGTLVKNGGSFKIDHPLDPENRYLSHSFVESPDMMNIYNGNVTTNEEGEAWVDLPNWFEALNEDFRYQLTVIGDFAQVIVAQEVHENRFLIRTDKPAIKVSWQVTGIRRDTFAEAHRIEVEEYKPEHQRGTYMHQDCSECQRIRAISAKTD